MPIKDSQQRAEYFSTYHKNYYIQHRAEILTKTRQYRKTTKHKVVEGKRGIRALCHPERIHRAFGLCTQCYHTSWQTSAYVNKPEFRESRIFADFKYRLKRNYGIEPEEWIRLLEKQGGACAICRVPFAGFPHVDHDHVT